MIRRATFNDLRDMVMMFYLAWKEMDFKASGIGWDTSSATTFVMQAMQSPVHDVFVSEDDAAMIDGGAIVAYLPSVMDRNSVMALEVAWHSHPRISKMRRARVQLELLKAMEDAALARGTRLRVATSNRIQTAMSVGLFLEKRGYLNTETVYVSGGG